MAFARFGRALNSLGEHLKATPSYMAARAGREAFAFQSAFDAGDHAAGFMAAKGVNLSALSEPAANAWRQLNAWRHPAVVGGAAGAVVGAGSTPRDRSSGVGRIATRTLGFGLMGAATGGAYATLRYAGPGSSGHHLRGSWSAFKTGWK